MSDLPERIWACMGGPMVGLFVSGGNNGGWPEYVSADIVQSMSAERDRLREALNQSRLAFAGYVSVQSAIDLIDRAVLKGENHD